MKLSEGKNSQCLHHKTGISRGASELKMDINRARSACVSGVAKRPRVSQLFRELLCMIIGASET